MFLVPLVVDPGRLGDPSRAPADLFIRASTVALFDVADIASDAVDLVVAVGYDSGAVVFFDAKSGHACAVTRPSAQPVRRLRFVREFHVLPPRMDTQPYESYPYPTANSGLFCVFGWSGSVGRLPTRVLVDAIAARRCDARGAGWVVWGLRSQDAVIDAIPCSSEPAAVCEVDPSPEEAGLRVVAAGFNPPIAAFSCGRAGVFSAKEVARKAAVAVYSAAKGVVYSRLSAFVPSFVSMAGAGEGEESDEEEGAVSAVVRASIAWADEPDSSSPLVRFGLQDVSDTARKSVVNLLARRQARLRTSGSGNVIAGGGASSDIPMSASASSTAAALPQNARLVQRCARAPLPCTLFASCDSLGRVLLMDARDLCVLRLLKGYRDAHVAWMSRNGPTLAILSPRRALVELHSPLESKRLAAFQIEPGTHLIESTSFSVFCFTPSGFLYELGHGRKVGSSEAEASAAAAAATADLKEVGKRSARAKKGEREDASTARPPTAETADRFLHACKAGQTSVAVEVLDSCAMENVHHVAHLMAMLVCTSSYVRAGVHVAVASRAARIAADGDDPDFEVRYEAHARLSEAFGLLAAEVVPDVLAAVPPTGLLRLCESDVFQDCVHACDESLPPPVLVDEAQGELVNCERFIIAHVVLPAVQTASAEGREYLLRPRDDLSESERIWLSRAYFARLLALDHNDLVRGADPEPASSRDVFMALHNVLGYSTDEMASYFVEFVLWSTLSELLSTPLALEQSGLRFVLRRLRFSKSQTVADDTIIHLCENTTRIGNAMLLVRLCVLEESPTSTGDSARYLGLLEQLAQAIQLGKYVSGSAAESSVKGRITARHFQGVSSESERHAVSLLAEGGEDERAAEIFHGLRGKQPRLEWHDRASISEVALQICRKRMAGLFNDAMYSEIAPNVANWIQEGGPSSSAPTVVLPSSPSDILPVEAGGLGEVATVSVELKGIQTLLIAAQDHFPDTSIDTVRCLQLAEAINVVLLAASSVPSLPGQSMNGGADSVKLMQMEDVTPSTKLEEKSSFADQADQADRGDQAQRPLLLDEWESEPSSTVKLKPPVPSFGNVEVPVVEHEEEGDDVPSLHAKNGVATVENDVPSLQAENGVATVEVETGLSPDRELPPAVPAVRLEDLSSNEIRCGDENDDEAEFVDAPDHLDADMGESN